MLVVDDSVVMRRLLSEVLASDPELEVAGYAANGQIALALLDQVCARHRDPGRRDAGDGRPGDVEGDARRPPHAAGHHVQHA